MKQKIDDLFWELEERFKERGLAELSYNPWDTREPAIYKAVNVHAFYKGEWNPTKMIYVIGNTENSTESEVCISAKLVGDTDRFLVSDELHRIIDNRAGLKVTPQELEAGFQSVGNWNASHDVVNLRLPYNAQRLEEAILEKIPESALR